MCLVWMNCWAVGFGLFQRWNVIPCWDCRKMETTLPIVSQHRLSMKNWKHVNAFMEFLAILPSEVMNRAKEDAQHGISHSIRYCTWMGYRKEDNSEHLVLLWLKRWTLKRRERTIKRKKKKRRGRSEQRAIYSIIRADRPMKIIKHSSLVELFGMSTWTTR